MAVAAVVAVAELEVALMEEAMVVVVAEQGAAGELVDLAAPGAVALLEFFLTIVPAFNLFQIQSPVAMADQAVTAV